MDCKQADAYMMKFMDDNYTKEETELFNQHLKSCAHCRESFSVYEEMMGAFSDVELHEAPEDLKCNVMEEIYKASKISEDLKLYLKKVIHGFIGIFFILLGVSLALFVHRDIIVDYMFARSETIYARVVVFVLGVSTQIFRYTWGLIANGARLLFNFITDYSIIILLVSIVLFCIPLLIDRKPKIKDDVFMEKFKKL